MAADEEAEAELRPQRALVGQLIGRVAQGLADGEWPWHRVVLLSLTALLTVGYFVSASLQARPR